MDKGHYDPRHSLRILRFVTEPLKMFKLRSVHWGTGQFQKFKSLHRFALLKKLKTKPVKLNTTRSAIFFPPRAIQFVRPDTRARAQSSHQR